MLQHLKDQKLVKLKGYAKLVKHQFEGHMGYDGKNKDVAYSSGKHQ